MESNQRPIQTQEADPGQLDDIPPAYNEATGTLDIQEDGLSAQTQIRSQCIALLHRNT